MRILRVLIFHGYLLRGTGSNIYNASLARALSDLGHEVHLVCQERDPPELGPRVTVHVPDIAGVLPVYVADAYEGFEAVPLPELDDERLARYLALNVDAVRAVAERVRPDVALANHLVMGPAILARALGGSVPYAVKVHGSALEYVVRPHPERFLPYAREGLAAASGVLVGSRHTAESLWEVVDGVPGLGERTRLGPPGVDVHSFQPLEPEPAAAALEALAARLDAGGAATGFGGDPGAGEALRTLLPGRTSRTDGYEGSSGTFGGGPVVGYVGKLIVAKGIDLLLAAWPLVVAAAPDARLGVIGFGTYREGCERIVAALAAADLGALREIAARGRELEGGPAGELRHLAAFVDGLEGERRAAWLEAAPRAAAQVAFTGRLEHGDLPAVLPSFAAQVVPSTFPEAFGMVAVEAAACAALPLSAAHSGLAEVTAALAPELPPSVGPLTAFEVGPGAVEEIAAKLIGWLGLGDRERADTRAALARVTRARYSWESVAEGVLAAARGRVEALPAPAPSAPGSG